MLQRSYFTEYEKMSRKILKYRGNPPPLKLISQYEKTLSKLREHLYQNNVKMPFPKYPYNEEDIRTHAFIRDIDSLTPIPNPNYIYKDFWKRIDGQKGVR